MQFGACWFWCCWVMVFHHVKAAVTTSSNRCDLTAKMCQELSYIDSMFKEQCYSLKSDVDVNTPPIIGDCASICHDDVDSKHRCRSLCQGMCLCICVYVYMYMCVCICVCVYMEVFYKYHYCNFRWKYVNCNKHYK